jgi:hypothetical protein
MLSSIDDGVGGLWSPGDHTSSISGSSECIGHNCTGAANYDGAHSASGFADGNHSSCEHNRRTDRCTDHGCHASG